MSKTVITRSGIGVVSKEQEFSTEGNADLYSSIELKTENPNILLAVILHHLEDPHTVMIKDARTFNILCGPVVAGSTDTFNIENLQLTVDHTP